MIKSTIENITQKSKRFFARMIHGNEIKDEIPWIQHAGFVHYPKDGQYHAWVAKDGDVRHVVAVESTDMPEIKAGETCLYRDKDHYIKISANHKVIIKTAKGDLFTILDELIDAMTNLQVHTVYGTSGIAPNSFAELQDIKNKLSQVMEKK